MHNVDNVTEEITQELATEGRGKISHEIAAFAREEICPSCTHTQIKNVVRKR